MLCIKSPNGQILIVCSNTQNSILLPAKIKNTFPWGLNAFHKSAFIGHTPTFENIICSSEQILSLLVKCNSSYRGWHHLCRTYKAKLVWWLTIEAFSSFVHGAGGKHHLFRVTYNFSNGSCMLCKRDEYFLRVSEVP